MPDKHILPLNHWGRVKMADISDTLPSKAFLNTNMRAIILLQLRPEIYLKKEHRRFGYWLVAD